MAPRLALLAGLASASLIGCGNGETSGTTSTPGTEGPAEVQPEPYLPQLGAEPPVATLGAGEVATVIEEQLGNFLSFVPLGLPGAIDAMMEHAEGGCPNFSFFDEGGITQIVWFDDCVTPSGAVFRGGFDYTVYDQVPDGDQLISGYETFAQDLEISLPDGRFLEGAGYFAFYHGDGKGFNIASNYGQGRWSADAATAGDDPWLSGQAEGTVSVYLGDWGDYHYASASGSVSVDDPEVTGLAFHDLAFDRQVCAAEPIGSASVREANGVWHDVTFARFEGEEGEEELVGCDGCGSYLQGGAPMDGGVCLSEERLGALVEWSGGLPW